MRLRWQAQQLAASSVDAQLQGQQPVMTCVFLLSHKATEYAQLLWLLLLQGTLHVRFALALSRCLACMDYVSFMRLLKGTPLLLAAVGQVRTLRHCHCRGGAAGSQLYLAFNKICSI
jgi:hypothetical protein